VVIARECSYEALLTWCDLICLLSSHHSVNALGSGNSASNTNCRYDGIKKVEELSKIAWLAVSLESPCTMRFTFVLNCAPRQSPHATAMKTLNDVPQGWRVAMWERWGGLQIAASLNCSRLLPVKKIEARIYCVLTRAASTLQMSDIISNNSRLAFNLI